MVLVDLLIYKEIKYNGWSLHAVPFYPIVEQTEIKSFKTNEDDTKRENEVRNFENYNKDSIGNPKVSLILIADGFNYEWIDKGRIFKKLITKKCATKNLRVDKNMHKVLDEKDALQNNNTMVQSIVREVNLQEIT